MPNPLSRDPVQEARDSVLSMFDDWRTFVAETFGRVPDTVVPMQDRERERLAALESALLRDFVARAKAKVEGAFRYVHDSGGEPFDCPCEHCRDRRSVLAALTELEEGTNGT